MSLRLLPKTRRFVEVVRTSGIRHALRLSLQFASARTQSIRHVGGRMVRRAKGLAASAAANGLNAFQSGLQHLRQPINRLARHAQQGGPAALSLLRLRAARAPRTVERHLALINFYETQNNRPKASAAAERALRWCPNNPELLMTLGRLQFHGDQKKATETLETLLAIEPNNARAWFLYAHHSRYSYERLNAADMAHDRAAALAPDDPTIQFSVAEYFRYYQNYEKAAGYYRRFFEVYPAALGNPESCRIYAECLSAAGQQDDAARMIATGLERSAEIVVRSEGEAWEVAKREEVRLYLAANNEHDANRVLRSIRNARAGQGRRFDRPEYLPRTKKRLEKFEKLIGSRDMLVLLQGPSFADFAPRLPELANADFAIATLGNFPPVEQVVAQALGRRVDVLMITNVWSVQSWYKELAEFLERPQPTLFLATRYALSNLGEFGTNESEFVARHDDRLLIADASGGPPLPSRPLHFETSNSFSLLLPLLAMARPRRIFIAGADGGGHPRHTQKLYFFHDDFDSELTFKGMPDRLAEANRRYRNETLHCDNNILLALRFMNALFDLPIPPIFNVCPHSGYEAFPKIDVGTAISMMREVKR